ncbi:DUF2971 domain-containing protein [Roseibium sp.]|uniref:DUF2971 domain-containing protein n=1 Tax=Roseibium sp. TaxID=1936156 RepID=UPI00326394E9
MRLYYFTPARHAIENIENQRLKISFADEVNDVFELRPFDFGTKKIRKLWGKHITEMSKSIGFICFAANWASPVMWAHYAKDHTGVCYGFDVAEDLVTPIRYVENLQHFAPDGKIDSTLIKRNMSYAIETKAKHWSYEEEARFYIKLDKESIAKKKTSSGRLFFESFSKSFALKEVILGMNSEISSERVVKSLKKGKNDVVVRTARPSFRKYAMVEQQLDRLKK